MRETFQYWVSKLLCSTTKNCYVDCLKLAVALYFDIFDVSVVEVVAHVERLGDIECVINGRRLLFTFRQFLLYHATRGFDSREILPVDSVDNEAVIELANWLMGVPTDPNSILSRIC